MANDHSWNQTPPSTTTTTTTTATNDFNPMIKYVPPSRQRAILAYPVQRISAAGHTKTASAETGFGIVPVTNHWSLYLQTSGSRDKWIRIDCLPSYSVPGTVMSGGSKAFVIISELPDEGMPRDVIKCIDLAVRPGLTVEDVVDLLISNGRHKYEFNREGTGCRHWVTDQVNLLHQRQYTVDVTQCEAARQAIVTLWPDGTHLDLGLGAYYQ